MVDLHHIVRFWKMDKSVFFLTFFVAGVCVVIEPTSGNDFVNRILPVEKLFISFATP